MRKLTPQDMKSAEKKEVNAKEELTRRTFVAGSIVAVAAAGTTGLLAGCHPESESNTPSTGIANIGTPAEIGEWIPSMCNMCFNACSILGHVVDGKLVEIKGDERSPAGWGHLCGKGLAGIQQLYDPSRITRPVKRTNPEKGLGIDPGWQEISWDEAYQTIVDKLAEQRDKELPIVLFGLITSMGTWLDSMTILRALGNTPLPLKADICGSPTHNITSMFTGCGNALPDYKNCKYLIQFGTQAGIASRHGTGITAKLCAEGRASGMKLVNFDPHMSGGAEKADVWVPIRPGTDAAAALCIANLLVNEYGLFDNEFVTNRTNAPSLVNPSTGRVIRETNTNKALYWDESDNSVKPYDQAVTPTLEGTFEIEGIQAKTAFSLFKEHVAAYTPEYTEQITTVPADTLRQVAKEFGEAALNQPEQTVTINGLEIPNRPAAVDTFSGLSRHKHGFHNHWACLQLNALVGSIFSFGGFLGFFTKNEYGFYDGDPDHTWAFDIWEEDGLINNLGFARGWPSNSSYYRTVRENDYTPTNGALSTLMPLATNGHCAYITQLTPDYWGVEFPPSSEVAFSVASNPLKNWCDNNYQERFLASFKWIFGIDIYLNDSSYYYDLIIPEPSYLERYDPIPLSFNNHRVPGALDVPFIVGARQPIVPAKDNCPSALDTYGMIAEKAGKTVDYAAGLNSYYMLADEYKLSGTEPVTAKAVCDAALKSLIGYDTVWMKENGVKTRTRTPEEVYVFAAGTEGRVPLYFDSMLEAKEKIDAKVAEMGIQHWDTNDYIPLAKWMPCVDHEVTDSEYDVLPIYWTDAINTDCWQVENAWIDEINAQQDNTYFLEVNPATATAKGIASGDMIRLTNKDGNIVEGVAVVSELVHPECVAAVGGHWNSQSSYEPIAKKKGYAVNHLVPAYAQERIEYVGGGVDQCVRCKLERIS